MKSIASTFASGTMAVSFRSSVGVILPRPAWWMTHCAPESGRKQRRVRGRPGVATRVLAGHRGGRRARVDQLRRCRVQLLLALGESKCGRGDHHRDQERNPLAAPHHAHVVAQRNRLIPSVFHHSVLSGRLRSRVLGVAERGAATTRLRPARGRRLWGGLDRPGTPGLPNPMVLPGGSASTLLPGTIDTRLTGSQCLHGYGVRREGRGRLHAGTRGDERSRPCRTGSTTRLAGR